MEDNFSREELQLPGTFGNHTVKLSRLFPHEEASCSVLLLHGVHSSANLSRHNKFRHLAELLAESGRMPWLCETSRREAPREAFGDDSFAWIKEAFGGKNFQNELDDCAAALTRKIAEKPESLWLWGFSLGGLTALTLVSGPDGVHAEKVIISGTGLVSMPAVERVMPYMPILSTLRQTIDCNRLKNVKTEELISFRGEYDEVFSEEACRELLAETALPAERKKFYTIKGADHSMKIRNNRYDSKLMDEMLSLIEAR